MSDRRPPMTNAQWNMLAVIANRKTTDTVQLMLECGRQWAKVADVLAGEGLIYSKRNGYALTAEGRARVKVGIETGKLKQGE